MFLMLFDFHQYNICQSVIFLGFPIFVNFIRKSTGEIGNICSPSSLARPMGELTHHRALWEKLRVYLARLSQAKVKLAPGFQALQSCSLSYRHSRFVLFSSKANSNTICYVIYSFLSAHYYLQVSYEQIHKGQR